MVIGPVFGGYRSMGENLSAQISARSAQEASQKAQTEIREFRADIERLLMTTEALWEMLKEEHGYTDEDLIKRLAEIDLRDGKIDGKVARTEAPAKCPECGRALARRRPFCIFCGTPIVAMPFDR
ncbi:MAG: hypothetical protein V1918_07600 [Planctomycetota bacterium]